MPRNDAVTIRKDNPVNLNLDDVDLELWGTLKLNHFDLIVKVADVSDNGIVLHLIHGFQHPWPRRFAHLLTEPDKSVFLRVMVLKLPVVVTKMSISATSWLIVATW